MHLVIITLKLLWTGQDKGCYDIKGYK